MTLITSQKGGIPLWLEALVGNISDKNFLRKSVDAYCRHLAEGAYPWFVLESAAYAASNIANWGSQKKWLTSVPETITEAQAALQLVATDELTQLANEWRSHSAHYQLLRGRWLVDGLTARDDFKEAFAF